MPLLFAIKRLSVESMIFGQPVPMGLDQVVAQAAHASLRLIPTEALALGVSVDGARVHLVVQATNHEVVDSENVADILDELEALLGPDVEVSTRADVRHAVRLDPDDGVRWFFAAR